MKRLIIDVREPEEFARGHIEGAINIPPSQLISGAQELTNIPKNTELILYCVSGSRSNVAIQMLTGKGYTNLTNGINQDHVKKNYLTH
jgi:rhodanese-related sulfurtransferase